MTKVNVTICLDYKVIQKHRTLHNNVSDLCNTFLANYGEDTEKIHEKATEDASQMVKAIEAQKTVETDANELNDKLREIRQISTTDIDKGNRLLHALAEEYHMEWSEIVRRRDNC